MFNKVVKKINKKHASMNRTHTLAMYYCTKYRGVWILIFTVKGSIWQRLLNISVICMQKACYLVNCMTVNF